MELGEEAKKHLEVFDIHRGKKELEEALKDGSLEKEERKNTKKALVMKDIGDYIVKHGKIDRGLVKSMIGGTMGEEELRRANVFAYHYSTNSYSFSTRALKTVYKVRYVCIDCVLVLFWD